jgi:hypothetical protein
MILSGVDTALHEGQLCKFDQLNGKNIAAWEGK